MRLIRLLKNDLAKESANWVDKDIISEQQAVAICNEYGTDYYSREQNSFLLNVLVGFGFFFIGIALIVLIGHNWEQIPRMVRMGGLVSITVIIQLLAWWQFKNKQNPLLFLLGNLSYGASIILIAQVYHLGEHMPDGILWWALGSLPFALLTRSLILMMFTLVLALIWFFMEVDSLFIPYLFPFFVFSAFWTLYKSRNTSLLLLLTSLFAFALLLDYSLLLCIDLFNGKNIYAIINGVFKDNNFGFTSVEIILAIPLLLFLYAWAVVLEAKTSNKAKDYSVFMKLWVLRFIVLMLVIFSFEDAWYSFLRDSWSGLFVLCIFSLLLLSSACWLVKNTSQFKKIMFLSLLIIVPLIFSCCVRLVLNDESLDSEVITNSYDVLLVCTILTNILAIISAVLLVIRGIAKGVRQYFFMGILLLIVIGFARYFDLIGNYIGASILFMFFSFVLLGAAKFWKNKMAKNCALPIKSEQIKEAAV